MEVPALGIKVSILTSLNFYPSILVFTFNKNFLKFLKFFENLIFNKTRILCWTVDWGLNGPGMDTCDKKRLLEKHNYMF